MKKIFFAMILSTLIFTAYSQSGSIQLKIVNIDDIEKNKEKGHPVIYLTGNQWKEFIKDAIKEKYDASKYDSSYGFKAIPIGDNPSKYGVIMTARPCPPGCDEDQNGACRNCKGQALTPCSIQGPPGNRYCSGICTSIKHCKMYVASADCGLIMVGCRCQ